MSMQHFGAKDKDKNNDKQYDLLVEDQIDFISHELLKGLTVCLFVCLSIHLFVCLTVFLSVHLFVCLTVCLSVHLYVCLSVHLSDCLSASLSLCLSICLTACLSLCLSVHLSDCLSASLSLCLSICLSGGFLPLETPSLLSLGHFFLLVRTKLLLMHFVIKQTFSTC